MTVDSYPLPTTEAPTRTMPDWFDFKTEHPDMKPPRRNDPRKARERTHAAAASAKLQRI